MDNNENTIHICKSVFKNGENTTTRDRFTKVWIELINKIEKGKRVKLSKK